VRRAAVIVALALVAGIAARVALVAIAPRYGFLGDHVDYVCWGRQAVARGVLDLYRTPPSTCPAIVYPSGGSTQLLKTGSDQILNYPPLATSVFWGAGHLLAALDPSQTANTVTARAVYAISTSLAELVTAAGAAALVGLSAGTTAAASAFALTLLAPPLLADGPFWGQTEAWILAPAIWMVWAMARERWLLAGALWGVALALKPSGLLFAPVWGYAFLFRAPRARVLLGGVAAAVVVNAAALPFWLSSGTAWLRTTYLANYVYDLHWTTMLTFNVWYIDLLLTERIDSRLPLLGLPRDLWGTGFLVLGLLGAFALARRWERRHPERGPLGIVPLATLVTIAAVNLPTRVHGTYAAFMAPFVICTAFLVPRAWPGAAAILVTATLQILSWQWGNLLAVHVLPNENQLPAARYAQRRALRARDRPREWALTLASLGAAAAVVGAVAAARPRRKETKATAGRRAGDTPA
jgi:hypothetical protein